jgi:hypothetical protein
LLVVGPVLQDRREGTDRRLSFHRAGHWRFLAVTHEHANHLVPLLQQQVRGDATVDAAAHG